ncbi:MAG: hypothetical protein GX227_11005 [Clostridiaceae bacterium]|jgi:hypothetical protein|nr:hypothetical protein [Clostridiaceae bacterium]
MKKVWLMFVLCSLMMVVRCSGKAVTEDMQAVSVDMTERVDVAEDVSDVETEEDSIKEEATVTTEENTDLTEQEQAVETEKKEALTQTISEEDVPVNPQEPTTQESSTQEPTEQTPATDETETDERGNPADGSPVFEITFNIPQAEYVGYDADRVARLAIDKCKAAGMISLPENLDNLLAEGKITQEEYNEYYPYDGCGYYSVFVETNLNLASTISGERLCSEEEIADYIAGMMVLEVEPYFYIECAGVYQGTYTDFYEFRCYR